MTDQHKGGACVQKSEVDQSAALAYSNLLFANVVDWYKRIKARPSFHEGIGKWENADYLKLMQSHGAEAWPQVRAMMKGH